VIEDLLLFIAVGFAAQLVDGAIGMAYGLTGTSVLLSLGITPAVASASIHAAEVFTTGAAGIAHWRFGNLDRSLIWKLAIPGMLGGAVGAYVLGATPSGIIGPIVSAYLLVMGALILRKAFRKQPAGARPPKRVGFLGLFGGLLDAIGGGGWGPLVTSTLIATGLKPRTAIGSSIAAEFFVTTVVSATFVVTIGLQLWPIIGGLIIGGVLAAPFAAYLARRLPDRPIMILVAAVVMLLSIRRLVQMLLGG
jgi:hypothetical protein